MRTFLRAFAEVGLVGFFPFAILYDRLDSFVVFRNTKVFFIEIPQAGKKLSVTWSEIIATAFETFGVDSYTEIC